MKTDRKLRLRKGEGPTWGHTANNKLDISHLTLGLCCPTPTLEYLSPLPHPHPLNVFWVLREGFRGQVRDHLWHLQFYLFLICTLLWVLQFTMRTDEVLDK